MAAWYSAEVEQGCMAVNACYGWLLLRCACNMSHPNGSMQADVWDQGNMYGCNRHAEGVDGALVLLLLQIGTRGGRGSWLAAPTRSTWSSTKWMSAKGCRWGERHGPLT